MLSTHESKIKRLLANRHKYRHSLSEKLPKPGYWFTPSPTDDQRWESASASPELDRPTPTVEKQTPKPWRKPLPIDCPVFDFSNDKTLIEETSESTGSVVMPTTILVTPPQPPTPPTPPKPISATIPARHTSRFYGNDPEVQIQLERMAQDERMILLSKTMQLQHTTKPDPSGPPPLPPPRTYFEVEPVQPVQPY
ncbi:uncharacterized protein BYT42DRAFT_266092 [Radiomyces spectabilis]|uniref:uncharacterized protein n=1 Tax=Radiomyces spectabilis TaxID=64574 RepID=UPI002220AA88|nr:uncharacterized protein BYT42DRAFT_266092 [Radiomyces spectabilis]KAI8384568.1 hypothetical protein BYT42DRAFT_266092 [Radiomyces spectabilis]